MTPTNLLNRELLSDNAKSTSKFSVLVTAASIFIILILAISKFPILDFIVHTFPNLIRKPYYDVVFVFFKVPFLIFFGMLIFVLPTAIILSFIHFLFRKQTLFFYIKSILSDILLVIILSFGLGVLIALIMAVFFSSGGIDPLIHD